MLFNFEGPKDLQKGESGVSMDPVNGGVAQLGEHLPCTQGVRSSILLISTSKTRKGFGKEGVKGNEKESPNLAIEMGS